MSRFYRAANESSESDSSGSDDEVAPVPRKQVAPRGDFVLSESDEETEKRVVKTTKDKRYDELRDHLKKMKNYKKIKDMHQILSTFEDLTRAFEKAKSVIAKEGGIVPRFYVRGVVELEDFVNEVWEDREGRKNLSKNNAKGLTTVRQKLKKYVKDFEVEMAAYRESPDPEGFSSDEAESEESEEESDEGLKKPVAKVSVEKPKKAAKEPGDEDESSEWEMSSSEAESDLEELEGKAMEDLRRYFLKKTTDKEATKKTVKPRRQKQQVQLEEPDEEGWQPVGKGGGPLEKLKLFDTGVEITQDVVVKKLNEILAARGKKRQDRKELVDLLKELLVVSNNHNLGAGLATKIQTSIIGGLFDYNIKMSDCISYPTWESAVEHIKETLALVQNNNVELSEAVAEDAEQLTDATQRYRVRGCLLVLLEKLDDEFTKMLQEADCHSTDYIERLKGEKPLFALIELFEDHFEKFGSKEEICRIYMKKVEHLYYKFDYEAAPKKGEENQDLATLQPSEKPASMELLDRLCKYIYVNDTTKRLRARAMLCQIYHHAMHDRWHAARDLMLMSHLQGSIDHADVQTQILYNRAICQLGLCAFRHGLIREAHNCLTEVQSGGKAKELLAQGLPLRQQQERTPEQEKLEKQRQVPYHMHINLELLECVYLICSMLLEVPQMASKEFELRRGRISRSFHYQLKQSERQSLTGPPENTREHVVAAAKALLVGDWRNCKNFVVNDKMNAKVWNLFHKSDEVKEMLIRRVQEESLRTYLFTYSSKYDTISMRNLAEMFELDLKAVHGIISKMIISEELAASLDEPAECVVVHRVEPTRLQTLALQLTEKLNGLAENNEQIMDPRSAQGYQYRPNYQNWSGQQRQQGGGQGEYRDRGGRDRGDRQDRQKAH